MSLHKLFDEINEDVEEYVDSLAEGTARVVARRTTLLDYPLTISAG